MELIKKIKEAEAQAQQIIEQAKTDAAGMAESGRQNRDEALAQAQQERKKATETAVAAAQSEAVAEVENLEAQAKKKRQQLSQSASDKMAKATTRIIDYLKG